MTSSIFNDILRKFDQSLQAENKRAPLLADNAGRLQPLDAGIIRAAKASYRTELVRHYLACAEDKKPQTVDLRWSLLAIARSWDKVNCNIIKNCWWYTGILPQAMEPDDEDPLDAIPLAQLKSLQAKGSFPSSDCAAQAYLGVDSTEDVAKVVSDDNILELVTPTDETNGAARPDEDSEEVCETLLVDAKDSGEARDLKCLCKNSLPN
ncbi:uncharacterized protein LOC135394574 [Ornithodoros turicata]|uniref:uncharacterized protein LOC135394574 n=1 Tax=Ornithodoros turicata TaxID=34597 RepID=UPI00313961DD